MTPEETRGAIAHLGRRAGFGFTPDQVDRLVPGGYPAAVAHLLDGLGAVDPAVEALTAPTFDTAGYLASRRTEDPAVRKAANRVARDERRALVRWWLLRMHAASNPLHEKLTWLWHDHFATSLAKVQIGELVYLQHGTLHRFGPGRFDHLLNAVARDPAMLLWLDGVENSRDSPNENFGRELMELFTLGHGGHHGGQPYTEADVKAAARALTGWRIDRRNGSTRSVALLHDAGTKTLLGETGPLDLDDVVRLVTRHEACAPHVVARLWSRLARPAGPDDPVVRELAEGYVADLDTTALLRRLLLHPEFLAPATRTGLIKTPVEWVIGSLRSLGLALPARIDVTLNELGQVPFVPPDVSGWPVNGAWLSTASARTRLEAAQGFARLADLAPLAATSPADRPDAVARVLGVDAWGPATRNALAKVAARPDELLTVALVAPEHLLA